MQYTTCQNSNTTDSTIFHILALVTVFIWVHKECKFDGGVWHRVQQELSIQ